MRVPSGAMSAYPVAMSSDGRGLGQAWAGAGQPYTWANGAFTPLGMLEGDTDPYPVALNGSGQAVGAYAKRYRAFWQDGVPTALADQITEIHLSEGRGVTLAARAPLPARL